MTSAWTASRVDLSEALAWRGRTTALASRVRRVPLASSRRVRETRCAAAPGGGARPIDPRLDAVVDALPIKEVLHRCLHELEVRAPRRSVLSRRHPSTASPKPMPYTPNRHARDAPRAQPRILPPRPPSPQTSSALVLQAPPGAGKTTTLPLAMLLSRPAWLGDGTILLLEPRRLAARAAANRMAAILGEPVGKTVGYRVRFDSKISASTRVEVVTEGILTRRLQTDPGLEGIAAVVFDEFHERSLDADLSLALTADVRAALRPELRLIIMSATLGQVGPAVASMHGEKETSSIKSAAPLLVSEGRSFPVETTYLGPPGRNFGDLETATVAAVRRALRENPGPEGGDVLCFLPGAGEINRVVSALRDDGVVALPLHGGLSREDQAAALAPAPPGTRRVVISTPIAESSLTIPGVRVVVDSGLRRAPRFDPRKG